MSPKRTRPTEDFPTEWTGGGGGQAEGPSRVEPDAVELYRLMTTRGLARGAGAAGTWVYHRCDVERWLDQLGGLVAVRRALRSS